MPRLRLPVRDWLRGFHEGEDCFYHVGHEEHVEGSGSRNDGKGRGSEIYDVWVMMCDFLRWPFGNLG